MDAIDRVSHELLLSDDLSFVNYSRSFFLLKAGKFMDFSSVDSVGKCVTAQRTIRVKISFVNTVTLKRLGSNCHLQEY